MPELNHPPNPVSVDKKTKQEDTISAEGMLGLLALGAAGLSAWRKRRAEVEGKDWRDTLAHQVASIEKEAGGGDNEKPSSIKTQPVQDP
ncbi:MAG: hypothetical protein KKB30_06220 [Proteobacteria bacterium]|nr:hypothetical protein [Pseudomonadota bacterium]MBU1715116.1 hypothetical protein [Pseudomonadota bacterium]